MSTKYGARLKNLKLIAHVKTLTEDVWSTEKDKQTEVLRVTVSDGGHEPVVGERVAQADLGERGDTISNIVFLPSRLL